MPLFRPALTEQFERFFVPAFTVVLFLLQGGWPTGFGAGWPRSRRLVAETRGGDGFVWDVCPHSVPRRQILGQPCVWSGCGLCGRSSYLLLGSYVCFAVTGSLAASLEHPYADLYVARVWRRRRTGAVETIINLILEVYRPRLKGQAARLVYDSRLVGFSPNRRG